MDNAQARRKRGANLPKGEGDPVDVSTRLTAETARALKTLLGQMEFPPSMSELLRKLAERYVEANRDKLPKHGKGIK